MFSNKFLIFSILHLLFQCYATELHLQMPSVRPQVETNLCRAYSIDKETHITGFVPQTTSDQAHHMIIYSCDEPGGDKHVWDCGEMEESTGKSNYEKGPVCSDERIIYAWAMEAPALALPKDVSFRVGGSDAPKYLVLQVHYKNVDVFKNQDISDSSGVKLITSFKPTKKSAGVYLIYSGAGEIPPGKTELKSSCVYEEMPVLHPFAYRVHAHQHGAEITGEIVRQSERKLIGRRSPQLPQMFQPINDSSLTIQKGDQLIGKCFMKNNEHKTYYIGPSASDEMCNFYIMYWVDGFNLPTSFLCPDPVESLKEDARLRNFEKLFSAESQDDDFGGFFKSDPEDTWDAGFEKGLEGMEGIGEWGSEVREGPAYKFKGESRTKVSEEAYENGEQQYSNKFAAHNKFSSDD